MVAVDKFQLDFLKWVQHLLAKKSDKNVLNAKKMLKK